MRTILSYKDYEALPADGRRYELHGGELSVTLSPSPKHQEVSLNLAVLLHHHAKTGKATIYPTPTPNSRPRRGMMDSHGRLWFGEYGVGNNHGASVIKLEPLD